MSDEPSAHESADPARPAWLKLIVLAGVVIVGGVVYTQSGDALSLRALVDQESQIRTFQQQDPVLIYGVAFLVYTLVTGLSIPGAAALTLIFGWFFGFWRAVLLVSFASTSGATIAFLLARFLLRETVQFRFGDRLKVINKALEREGAFYLFTLRLIPFVPFFVLNLVMGLTPIRTRTYWWVSQLGMLPGTAVYVYAGSSVPDLSTLAGKGTSSILTPNVLFAFVVLGLFPLVAKKVMQTIRRRSVSAGQSAPSDSGVSEGT
ncbi:MAG: TVP38/TMEM64 family protein [Planctomycetaceae bacterium]|nr:TVP38/TMEM64 family protein [Planctomycetaceae bacterium]